MVLGLVLPILAASTSQITAALTNLLTSCWVASAQALVVRQAEGAPMATALPLEALVSGRQGLVQPALAQLGLIAMARRRPPLIKRLA